MALDLLGSTCVKSDVAQCYIKIRMLWSFFDLMNLIDQSFTSNISKPLNYKQLITEILSCDFGTRFNHEQEIYFSEEHSDVGVPIVKNEVTSEDQIRIQDFLKTTGIYILIHKLVCLNLLLNYETKR
jgi:hypothetical protein